MTVLAGTAVAGDSVFDDLAASAGGVELGGISEVTDNGDAGNVVGGGGAEGTGGNARGNGGATEERGGHVDGREGRFLWCLGVQRSV